MITGSNQVCFVKMIGQRVQEVVLRQKFGLGLNPMELQIGQIHSRILKQEIFTRF